MHDFDVAGSDDEGHSGAQEVSARAAARQSEWDFEAGISTRKTLYFDGLTSLQQKIKEKRAKYAPSKEPAKSAEEAGDEGDDSDAGSGGGESAGAGAGQAGSGSDGESDDGSSGSGSGSDAEDGSGSGSDGEDGSAGSGEASSEGEGSGDDGEDGDSSSDDDSIEEDEEDAAEAAAAAMEADRTRQIKEQRIAPAEDAAGKGYFELDPFLANGTADEAESFSALHLSRPLLRAVAELGYSAPTPIQVRYFATQAVMP